MGHPAATASWSSWVHRVPLWAVDAVIAGAAVLTLVGERLATAPSSGPRLAAAVALAAIIGGSLAPRRRLPVAAYTVGTTGLAVEALWLGPGELSTFANLVGIAAVGAHATRRRTLWGPVIMLPGVGAYFAGQVGAVPPVVPAGVVFGWLCVWAFGYAGARRREQHEADRQLARRDAVLEERQRVAREMHDLVGHTMSVMLVGTGAARVVVHQDADRAREILAGVERTGREALDELDRVLGLLGGDDGSSLQPGLEQLPQLVERMRGAGMDVTVHLEPTHPLVPGALDLALYRIVQESLTNALRHGGAASSAVTVRWDGRVAEVEVVDDGGGPGPGYLAGRGLGGIMERAAAFGGTVEHGPGEDEGFRVRAVLPSP